ncbi:hypothetical protein pb186bvf_013255 [Paramecium bursaria]
MEGDKIITLNNNQNLFTLPMMRELAQAIVFMKIYGYQNQAQAEKYKLCYQIQDVDRMKRLNKISDCFKQYKSDYQKLLDKFKNAKETLSQIKREFESKKCNCYSLVSESEVDACLWEFDQAYLKKSSDFLKSLE